MKFEDIKIRQVDLKVGDQLRIIEKNSRSNKSSSFQKIFANELKVQGIDPVAFNLPSDETITPNKFEFYENKYNKGFSIHLPENDIAKFKSIEKSENRISDLYNFASYNLTGKLVNLTF